MFMVSVLLWAACLMAAFLSGCGCAGKKKKKPKKNPNLISLTTTAQEQEDDVDANPSAPNSDNDSHLMNPPPLHFDTTAILDLNMNDNNAPRSTYLGQQPTTPQPQLQPQTQPQTQPQLQPNNTNRNNNNEMPDMKNKQQPPPPVFLPSSPAAQSPVGMEGKNLQPNPALNQRPSTPTPASPSTNNIQPEPWAKTATPGPAQSPGAVPATSPGDQKTQALTVAPSAAFDQQTQRSKMPTQPTQRTVLPTQRTQLSAMPTQQPLPPTRPSPKKSAGSTFL